MSRISKDHFEGRLIDGYDYNRQVWVKNGRYERCGHPDTMICNCYGREHMGEPTIPEPYGLDMIPEADLESEE